MIDQSLLSHSPGLTEYAGDSVDLSAELAGQIDMVVLDLRPGLSGKLPEQWRHAITLACRAARPGGYVVAVHRWQARELLAASVPCECEQTCEIAPDCYRCAPGSHTLWSLWSVPREVDGKWVYSPPSAALTELSCPIRFFLSSQVGSVYLPFGGEDLRASCGFLRLPCVFCCRVLGIKTE